MPSALPFFPLNSLRTQYVPSWAGLEVGAGDTTMTKTHTVANFRVQRGGREARPAVPRSALSTAAQAFWTAGRGLASEGGWGGRRSLVRPWWTTWWGACARWITWAGAEDGGCYVDPSASATCIQGGPWAQGAEGGATRGDGDRGCVPILNCDVLTDLDLTIRFLKALKFQ